MRLAAQFKLGGLKAHFYTLHKLLSVVLLNPRCRIIMFAAQLLPGGAKAHQRRTSEL